MDGPKKYLRCPCTHCGKTVEFPAYAAGGMTLCPHCGKSTKTTNSGVAASPPVVQQKSPALPPAPSPPTPAAKRSSTKSRTPAFLLGAACLAIVMGVGVYRYWPRGRSETHKHQIAAVSSNTLSP